MRAATAVNTGRWYQEPAAGCTACAPILKPRTYRTGGTDGCPSSRLQPIFIQSYWLHLGPAEKLVLAISVLTFFVHKILCPLVPTLSPSSCKFFPRVFSLSVLFAQLSRGKLVELFDVRQKFGDLGIQCGELGSRRCSQQTQLSFLEKQAVWCVAWRDRPTINWTGYFLWVPRQSERAAEILQLLQRQPGSYCSPGVGRHVSRGASSLLAD